MDSAFLALEPNQKQVLVETNGETYLVQLPENDFYNNQSDQEDTPDGNISLGSSPNILQSWAPTPEEKLQLQVQGQTWKQGLWSKKETERLKQNVIGFCEEHGIANPCQIIFESGKEKRKDFYKTVAKGINRPLFSVYRRIVRMYDAKNHIGKYSAEELQKLRDLRKQHGNDWQKIGAAMGRSAASIKDRCRHLKEDCNSGPWTCEEEDQLAEAVYALAQALPGENTVSGIPWTQVAIRVGTRSERQCRKKWLSYVNIKRLNGSEWTQEDELHLVNQLTESGAENETDVDWLALYRSWPRPSVRSHQWLRAKWRRLKSLVKDHQNRKFKDICQQLSMHLSSGIQYVNMPTNENSSSISFCTELNSNSSSSNGLCIGILPTVNATSVGVNFNLGLAPSSVVIAPPCVSSIPMYLGCPILPSSTTCMQLQTSGISFVSSHPTHSSLHGTLPTDNVTVVHLDLDGGEDSAVTTDVMLSGSSICIGQGSPLGLTDDKGDDVETPHDSVHSDDQ